MKANKVIKMSDEAFESFLSAKGAEWRATVQINPQLQQKCLVAMADGRAQARRLRTWGRKALVSTMGLAAAVVLIVTFAFPPNGNAPVLAKTVLAKLAEQVQGDGVLTLSFNAVRLEEVSIEGHLQIASDSVAGDLHVSVQEEGDESPIVIDASLGITPEKGWVLLRRLELPDPQAQAMIQFFVSKDTPTLIVLPQGILKEIELDAHDKHLADIRRLATGELADIVRGVLKEGADLGAVTTQQPDGTTLVTLRVQNVEVLHKLVEIAAAATGKQVDADLDISEDDAKELLGCTLAVIYDPQSQKVRSFSVSDVAEMKGTITIGLHDGVIDPAMFDSARVAAPGTRTIDTGFLKGLIEAATGDNE